MRPIPHFQARKPEVARYCTPAEPCGPRAHRPTLQGRSGVSILLSTLNFLAQRAPGATVNLPAGAVRPTPPGPQPAIMTVLTKLFRARDFPSRPTRDSAANQWQLAYRFKYIDSNPQSSRPARASIENNILHQHVEDVKIQPSHVRGRDYTRGHNEEKTL